MTDHVFAFGDDRKAHARALLHMLHAAILESTSRSLSFKGLGRLGHSGVGMPSCVRLEESGAQSSKRSNRERELLPSELLPMFRGRQMSLDRDSASTCVSADSDENRAHPFAAGYRRPLLDHTHKKQPSQRKRLELALPAMRAISAGSPSARRILSRHPSRVFKIAPSALSVGPLYGNVV